MGLLDRLRRPALAPPAEPASEPERELSSWEQRQRAMEPTSRQIIDLARSIVKQQQELERLADREAALPEAVFTMDRYRDQNWAGLDRWNVRTSVQAPSGRVDLRVAQISELQPDHGQGHEWSESYYVTAGVALTGHEDSLAQVKVERSEWWCGPEAPHRIGDPMYEVRAANEDGPATLDEAMQDNAELHHTLLDELQAQLVRVEEDSRRRLTMAKELSRPQLGAMDGPLPRVSRDEARQRARDMVDDHGADRRMT